jgi:hypothetical protein
MCSATGPRVGGGERRTGMVLEVVDMSGWAARDAVATAGVLWEVA